MRDYYTIRLATEGIFMATKTATVRSQNTAEMQAAAALILQQEELRQEQARRRAKRRRRRRRQEERLAVQKMHRSIEVIKWCIVAICTVWIISFVISIVVLVKVQNRVTEIEGQVDRIRHTLDNPFASAGSRLGGELDEKWREFWRLPDQEADK